MLIDLLRDAAAAAPDQPAVVAREGTTTYAECLQRAESLARGLHARGIVRFGCVVGVTSDLLALVCASSATGSEACIYPAALDDGGVDGYAKTFDHPTIVTDRPLVLTNAEAVAVEALARDEGSLPPRLDRAPTMILTTGTTGHQKGARHDWNRLVAAAKHPDEKPGARWLLAYNLNQFAGIQLLLHVLTSRATMVVPPSNQPRDAAAMMRDFGVTHVSATPTFWRFVTSLLDDEAAREIPLKQLTLGGEAVPASLLKELERLYPQARISQVYGATEFGLGVSVRDGRPGLPLSVLERGDDADVQMRIVDGQLQVRSRIGMLGYYGEDDTDEGWRSTGDLVEMRDDRVHFVGRSSERINVGGVKVHPLPVEEIVSAIDGVELARAYGRANPVTGQIVAVDVVARPGADTEQLDAEIRAACETLPEAARPRRIRFVTELDVRGQKIARQAHSSHP